MVRVASEIISDDADEFGLVLLHFEGEEEEITGEEAPEEE